MYSFNTKRALYY